MSTTLENAASEWRANWPVVLAGAAGVSLAALHHYSTGVMIGPLEQEFGWSRALISSGAMIVAVIGVILAPLVGMLIDRIGPRRVAVTGAFLFCAFVAGLSLTTRNIWTWWILWCGIAISGAFIVPTVWAAGVSGLFVRSRGMALALTLCGTSIGAMLVPAVTHSFVERFGWRGAYVALAGAWALVTLPLIYFFFTSWLDRNRTEKKRTAGKPISPPTAAAVRAAILSARFLKLAGAAVSIVVVISSLFGNFVPILAAEGHSTGRAAAIAALLGVGSFTGRIFGGYLLDRINGSIVAGIAVLMPVITCLLLLGIPESVAASAAAVLILGLAAGVEWDAVAYLASRHFNINSFGTVFGTIGGLLLLMHGVGPFLTNYIYDVAGSYVPALWALIPLCVLSSILFLTLGPYPSAESKSAPAAELAGDRAASMS